MFDISHWGAFFGGLASFFSPCILPIVPFYLSYLAGVNISEISQNSQMPSGLRKRAFIASLIFSLGVITVFVALGAGSSFIGQIVREYFHILRWGAAAIVIAMGLHFLGVVRIGFLYRQFKTETGSTQNVSYLGAYVIGLAFAFGWTPCVGPILTAILFLAANTDTAGDGALLLFVYGLGMTLPFVLAAIFVERFMKIAGRFRKYLGTVEKIIGVFLIVFGVLIATNSVSIIAQFMIDYMPWFARIG